MGAAAAIAVLITIGFGVIALGFWSGPVAPVTVHIALATAAVASVVIAVASRSGFAGGLALSFVGGTAALGLVNLASLGRRGVPPAVLVLHGAAAATALVVTVAFALSLR